MVELTSQECHEYMYKNYGTSWTNDYLDNVVITKPEYNYRYRFYITDELESFVILEDKRIWLVSNTKAYLANGKYEIIKYNNEIYFAIESDKTDNALYAKENKIKFTINIFKCNKNFDINKFDMEMTI